MKNNGLSSVYMRNRKETNEIFFLLHERNSNHEHFWSQIITDLHLLKCDSSIGETLDDLGCVRLAYDKVL